SVGGAVVAVGGQRQPLGPGGGPGHQFADLVDGGFGWGFDDDLVVDVENDAVAGGGDDTEGVGQEVAGDGLGDVLGELPAVGLLGLEFPVHADALEGDAGLAESVGAQPGAGVDQRAAGRQGDGQRPGAHAQGDGADPLGPAGADRVEGGLV